MARARPLLLVVVLLCGLAGAWLLGGGGERSVEVPRAPERVHAPERPATASQGPVLAGSARPASSTPVIVGGARPPRSEKSPSGATEVLGVVIDEEGRGYHGGVVRAVRGGTQPALLGEAPVVEGRFHLTFALDASTDLLLTHRDPPRAGSRFTIVSVVPGERWEGVELLVEPMGVLEIEVRDASGVPAPDAVVDALTGPALPVERIPLDGQGRARLVLSALDFSWISATSPDGRFFARENLTVEPGATTHVALRLTGPWERLAVRVVSEPARFRTGEKAQVTVGKREPVGAEVEGGPVFVWMPPGDSAFHVDASLGDPGSGRFTVSPGSDERERVLRDGVRVVVPLKAPLAVDVVDAHGRPVPGVRLWLNPWANDPWERGNGLSDQSGRVALGFQPMGSELPLRAEWGDLPKVVVPADGRALRVVLPDPSSFVAGVVEPSTPRAVLPGSVHLHVGTASVSAIIDPTPRPEGFRWRAYVPFPAGTPLTATAGGVAVEGVCGQEDLRLGVRAGTLEIAPRMGSRLRPRGHLRIEPLPLDASRAETGSVEVAARWGFCPRWTGLAPGRYQASWLPEAEKAWRTAPEPIEVRVGENRFEIDFGPP